MLNKNKPAIFWWIISAFLIVPLIVSIISTIHVINFFELSNHTGLALTLAIAFELGALSALAGLVALDKINKNVVWFIFLTLTIYQCIGNTYHAYDWISVKMQTYPNLVKNWAELFGITNESPEDLIVIKRIIAIMSGAILPIVSLSFLDLSVNYIQKSRVYDSVKTTEPENVIEENVTPIPIVEDEPIADIIPEPEIEPEVEQESELITVDDDFEKFIKNKKRQVENMREPNLELLDIFYNGGNIQKGDELLTYSELLSKIDMSRFNQKEINFFLTLCNYLEIFKLSGTHRIALKTYQEAIDVLNNYLSIGDETA